MEPTSRSRHTHALGAVFNLTIYCHDTSTVPNVNEYHSRRRRKEEQNRLLLVANEDLLKQISGLKENVSVLEQRCSDLQENNTDIKKQLRDCHELLIVENLDPVSGEKVGVAAEQQAGQRKELMTVSQKLLSELKLFDDFTKEHRTHLTEVQNTMRSLKGAREKLHLERESFCTYTENMERALEDAERLLME
ncbi:hypothetical protein AMELA_G00229840 [Ameiurus melas]|uniref:Uncharacterized protein n=1 Tax=Ameiurus melas TaxID=219545 RepID=A0A7J5ZYK5_AMEME|nr:hypothetical protein AMELA_G00229840 [Ameiurus melas]